MPLLDRQRQTYQIGRIRIGQLVPVKPGSDKTRPARLEHFRFTTSSRSAAAEIARLYGGEVHEWTGHPGEYEVFTRVSEIGVTVSPYDEVVTQWYEMWTRGGCQRRCNSKTEKLSGGPCQCPADPEERTRLAAQNPPKACKAVTRVSLILPDLPGVGVWRLDTGSWYAAGEMADQARVLEMARDRGIFVPAVLRIEQRTRVAKGETKKFAVPVLQPLVTIRQLVSGELEQAGMTAQLPPPPGQPLAAITSTASPATPAIEGTRGAPATPPAPAAGGDQDALSGEQDEENGISPDDPEEARSRLAREIAHKALAADPAEFKRYLAQVKADEALADEYVEGEPGSDSWDRLQDYLERLWSEKVEAGRARRRSQSGAA